MHPTQQALLSLIPEKNLASLTLRQIAELISKDTHPQLVKHHLEQLRKKGLIKIDPYKGVIELIKRGSMVSSNMVAVPILGTADCGPATSIPQDSIEGYLHISSSILKKKGKNIFALRAKGTSMNKANIYGNNIEDGDYVLIDSNDRDPKDNSYVLSIIDGMANIKKFILNKKDNQIVLVSESAREFPPIYISRDEDYNYMVNGTVTQIIKSPKNLSLV